MFLTPLSFETIVNFMARKFAGIRPSSGQSLTELAIALPLLIIIVMGVVDLGRMYYTYVAVANAAREAARLGAGLDCTDPQFNTKVQNKALAEAGAAGITLVTPINPTWPDGACVNSQGKAIQVTTVSNFQLMTAEVLGGATIPLRATTQFQNYYGTLP